MFMFVKNEKYVETMKSLCGIRIFYELLNYDKYYSKETKEMLIKSINREWDDEEDEEEEDDDDEKEMVKLIKDEETKEEIKPKEISSFSYPHSEYLFQLNEEISIIPTFDGEKCEFSTNPSLPDEIIINKKNGIINGKVENEVEKKEYEIYCKNRISEKKFKISLEIVDIKFIELNKGCYISISNNGKLITKINDNKDYSHCYLNLKMENGIYHIKYQFHQNGNEHNHLRLGLSTNNTYYDDYVYTQAVFCYRAYGGKSQDISEYCHSVIAVNKNPNFNNHGDGSIYEVIVDMNKREFWISHNNSSPVLLVKDLPSPLYPFSAIGPLSSSI